MSSKNLNRLLKNSEGESNRKIEERKQRFNNNRRILKKTRKWSLTALDNLLRMRNLQRNKSRSRSFLLLLLSLLKIKNNRNQPKINLKKKNLRLKMMVRKRFQVRTKAKSQSLSKVKSKSLKGTISSSMILIIRKQIHKSYNKNCKILMKK